VKDFNFIYALKYSGVEAGEGICQIVTGFNVHVRITIKRDQESIGMEIKAELDDKLSFSLEPNVFF
jgi:hypothetical protein